MTARICVSWKDPAGAVAHKTIDTPPIIIGRRSGPGLIGLDSPFISNRHAKLEQQGDKLVLIDLESKNGTLVNGEPIGRPVELNNPGRFSIGSIEFSAELKRPPSESHLPEGRDAEDSVLTFHPETGRLSLEAVLARIQQPEPTLQRLLKQQTVRVQDLEQIAPVETFAFCAVGGGVGSFTWVDHLVIFGADPKGIVSIGYEAKPYGRYRKLCENSQIPDHERLRSNSDSCPDNIWGWPGYAVREFWSDAIRLRWFRAAGTAWQIFNEPYVQTYTPKSGRVFDSIDREAARIGWDQIFRRGRVRAIRKTDDGRYAVFYSKIDGNKTSQTSIVVAPFIHLAVGYPGVRFLPDLKNYRDETKDFDRVVNAYEKHDHIYANLAASGGTVVIRGRGIVASRVIQKIKETREESGREIHIINLMRSPKPKGNRYKLAQRPVDHNWEFQPFNWPKAAWGGDLRVVLEQANDSSRDGLLGDWGGTTTADRHDWRDMIDQGLREGWYEIRFGQVKRVTRSLNGQVISHMQGQQTNGMTEIAADYIIDATGLESGIDRHALLHDLVTLYDLGRNPKGRLAVDENFVLTGMDNGHGRIYAAGVATLGGPYAPVDSFLGLQFAAQRAVDDSVTRHAPGLRRLNRFRSLRQWVRWARGVQP